MTVGFNTVFQKQCPVVFKVKNISSPGKTLRIFNLKIKKNEIKDLMSLPYVSEADIKHSLLKGELNVKIRSNELLVTESNIDLSQFNSCHKDFLKNSGVSSGVDTVELDSTVDPNYLINAGGTWVPESMAFTVSRIPGAAKYTTLQAAADAAGAANPTYLAPALIIASGGSWAEDLVLPPNVYLRMTGGRGSTTSVTINLDPTEDNSIGFEDITILSSLSLVGAPTGQVRLWSHASTFGQQILAPDVPALRWEDYHSRLIGAGQYFSGTEFSNIHLSGTFISTLERVDLLKGSSSLSCTLRGVHMFSDRGIFTNADTLRVMNSNFTTPTALGTGICLEWQADGASDEAFITNCGFTNNANAAPVLRNSGAGIMRYSGIAVVEQGAGPHIDNTGAGSIVAGVLLP